MSWNHQLAIDLPMSEASASVFAERSFALAAAGVRVPAEWVLA